MQLTFLLTLTLASIVASAPLSDPHLSAPPSTRTTSPPFRAQLSTTSAILPEGELPLADVDNRNFVFHIPSWADGRTCFPFLDAATDIDESGVLEVATLEPDGDRKGEVDVWNVYGLAKDRVLGGLGLFERGVVPTVEVTGGWEFRCEGGSVVALRLSDSPGNAFFKMSNSSGRFRINVV